MEEMLGVTSYKYNGDRERFLPCHGTMIKKKEKKEIRPDLPNLTIPVYYDINFVDAVRFREKICGLAGEVHEWPKNPMKKETFYKKRKRDKK